MNPAAPVAQQAAFWRGATGSRLRLISEPAAMPAIGTIIAVHAFAEEMNKCRRMCARMARGLASDGWRVVQRDLLGCGDSAGDFADASWQAWTDDVSEELALADPARPVWLWGVRAGALLAGAALARRPDANLLLWQPVMSGAQHLQQFLRLHAGARIVGSGKASGDVPPAQRLRSGLAVELGGYELSPALAGGLEQATFDVPAAYGGRIAWLEVSADASPQLSPAAVRVIERLRARGVTIEAQSVSGPGFWQTQEIEESEALLVESRVALARAVESVLKPRDMLERAQ
jgi:uncharacterized protein